MGFVLTLVTMLVSSPRARTRKTCNVRNVSGSYSSLNFQEGSIFTGRFWISLYVMPGLRNYWHSKGAVMPAECDASRCVRNNAKNWAQSVLPQTSDCTIISFLNFVYAVYQLVACLESLFCSNNTERSSRQSTSEFIT